MIRQCFLWGLIGWSVSAPAQPPNIIVIYTDDQGFGDASCLNPDAKFKTPHLDRLAAEGVSFTNAHSSDSVCTPSRYGLLTGRYAWRTRLKQGVMGAEGECLISDSQATIASVLRDAGYRTAMVGKWHLGMDFPGTNYKDRDWSKPTQDMPLDKGFDEFFGIPASMNYGVLAWFEGRYAAVPPTVFTAKKANQRHSDYRIMPPYQDSPQATRQAIGKIGMEVAPDFIDNQCLTRFTDRAIDWIDDHASGERRQQPFLMYLPLTSPHYPVCPLPEFYGQGECGGYGEFVIETDHHVGRLLKFLDNAKLSDNTLIVFTSDNGPENSWAARAKKFGHHSNYVFREGKRSVYEGGHRVPFFVRWPAGIDRPGRVWDRPIGQIDLLATFAEIVGAKLSADAGVDSQSFAAVLQDSTSDHTRLPLINHGVKGRFAITDGNWKLVMPHGKAGRELYDLAADPGEQSDVLDQHPQRAADLERQITQIVQRGRTTPGQPQSNDTGYWDDLTWIDPGDK
ncbi:sulfatase family protein [Stieleria tagensis]|uniref:sulfatase family protein n=1 Tax=Stieleria tagensis TaxID=2956795 RepID=UPI00209A6FDF|nr:arylsulfatase [Stieleria tagensis]